MDIDEKGSPHQIYCYYPKGIPIKYIDIIKDMFDGVVANVRTCGGITSDFSITIGLHQDLLGVNSYLS